MHTQAMHTKYLWLWAEAEVRLSWATNTKEPREEKGSGECGGGELPAADGLKRGRRGEPTWTSKEEG